VVSPLFFLNEPDSNFGWCSFSSAAADVWRAAGLRVDAEPSDEIDHETAAEVAQNDMRCDADYWRAMAARAVAR
jgi:hypothetical protein